MTIIRGATYIRDLLYNDRVRWRTTTKTATLSAADIAHETTRAQLGTEYCRRKNHASATAPTLSSRVWPAEVEYRPKNTPKMCRNLQQKVVMYTDPILNSSRPPARKGWQWEINPPEVWVASIPIIIHLQQQRHSIPITSSLTMQIELTFVQQPAGEGVLWRSLCRWRPLFVWRPPPPVDWAKDH